MAFSAAGFSPDGRASGVKIHTYYSTDSIATVRAIGYFNAIALLLKVRDVICVVDTATPTTSWVNVLSNASGVVNTSDGTVIVETDS